MFCTKLQALLFSFSHRESIMFRAPTLKKLNAILSEVPPAFELAKMYVNVLNF